MELYIATKNDKDDEDHSIQQSIVRANNRTFSTIELTENNTLLNEEANVSDPSNLQEPLDSEIISKKNKEAYIDIPNRNGISKESIQNFNHENSLMRDSASLSTPSSNRKAYNCRKCGKPLKGHKCSLIEPEILVDSDDTMTEPKTDLSSIPKKNIKRRKLLLVDEAKNDLASDDNSSSSAATDAFHQNFLNTRNDDESSWDDDNDVKAIWLRKRLSKTRWFEDSPLHRNNRMKRDIVLSSDDNDRSAKSENASAKTRLYNCRLCGVPRKGHICPYRMDRTDMRPTKTPSQIKNRYGRLRSTDNLSMVGNHNESATGAEEASSVQLTEVLVPVHVLLDEVHSYLQQRSTTTTNPSSDTEKLMLQQWCMDTYDNFLQINDSILEKRKITESNNDITKSINTERDSLVALRSKIRWMKNRNRNLENRITLLQQENNTNISSSQFLSAIDKLR